MSTKAVHNVQQDEGIWTALCRPKDPERLAALAKRRADYPAEQFSEEQSIGRYVVGCGATHGVHEACNFGCTACYLSNTANRQKPMAFAKVHQQLKALRNYLGPGGNVQITSGEVTLLPADQLTRIVRAAVDLNLSPMVMTHGDILHQNPAYLDQLVRDGGLRKLSIHVDTTQRGRRHFSRVDEEADLNEVRNQMADLLGGVRQRTGVRLKAATTMTVDQDNLKQLPAVINWFVGQTAFRILSLQPQARTGRTKNDNGTDAAEVWAVLEGALGAEVNPHAFVFGHKSCNRIALCLVFHTPQPIVVQAVRPNNHKDRAFMDGLLTDFAGIVLYGMRKRIIAARLTGMLLRKPTWLLRVPAYALVRSFEERRHIPAVIGAFLRGKLKLHALAFVVHAFMSQDELATETGRERLAACTFKISVDGRMVSMCEMNATDIRESTYQQSRVVV